MLGFASSAVMGDRERLGSRLLAFAGLWSLLIGILMSLSFVGVALVASAVLLLVVLAIGGVALLRRFRIRERLWTLLVSAAHAVRGLGQRLDVRIRRRVKRLGVRARQITAAAPGRANAFRASALRSYAVAVSGLRIGTSRLVSATSSLVRVLRRRQALQLNELGAQLRRRGDYEQAAKQHLVALAIVRDLGDTQAEALTLNNLALALAQGGAQAEAVQHLEQALVILHELGDEEHEWRVLANLGIVHRRQGHSEQAVHLLHEALDRLPPESSAYRQVEQELRRAS
jgi:tetratricopeptide (TPR) repeat protein